MAFVIPILTTIGGGSAAAGAVTLGTAVAGIATGVISAGNVKRAGKFTEAQSEIDANAEGDSAREREIQRKRNLMRAISSQLATAGSAGINFAEGSPAGIAQLDIDDAARDLQIDTASSRQRQVSTRARGRAARVTGDTQAVITLLDTAGRAATTLG